jgi:hypothetical protein
MIISEKKLRAFIRKFIISEKNTRSRSYRGKSYTSSKGSQTALKKHGGSTKKAVEAGAFDWADPELGGPYAAANAAKIVATGSPTVKRGTKRKKKKSAKK